MKPLLANGVIGLGERGAIERAVGAADAVHPDARDVGRPLAG